MLPSKCSTKGSSDVSEKESATFIHKSKNQARKDTTVFTKEYTDQNFTQQNTRVTVM